MVEWLIGLLSGAVAAVFIMLYLRKHGGGGKESKAVNVHHSLQQLRAVGELVVFKLVTQQIVTAEEHLGGKFGKNWLPWLLSSKKMAMVIEYSIDFKFNLRDEQFRIEEKAGGYLMHLPSCTYQTNIRDIKFYDEKNSRWLPWLLGDMTSALGPGFSEEDKNKLIQEARREADSKAEGLVHQLSPEVKSSARETLRLIARGFGTDNLEVDFDEITLKQIESAEDVVPKAQESK